MAVATGSGPEGDRERRLDLAIAEYFEAATAGMAEGRDAWAERYHPDLADDLRAYFADEDRLLQVAPPLARPGPGIARTVGDYELLEVIGVGGMGVVYRARHREMGRVVALKMVLAGPLARPDDLLRFAAEVRAIGELDHPHIIPLYEFSEHAGFPYFTMKLAEGGSLAARKSDFLDDLGAAARTVAAVAQGVHHAHQRGFLHRDLKPSNILLDRDGNPYVADFGLVRRSGDTPEVTRTGDVLGSPAYMAPEQLSGRNGAVTTATDVYGLGAIFYTLLTGRAPHAAESVAATFERIARGDVEFPSRSNPRVDGDLDALAMKCLEHDPARRYASALALADDLGRWLSGVPTQARPVGWPERAWRWCRRNPALAAMSGSLILAVASAVVILAVGYVMVDGARKTAEERANYAAHKDLMARQMIQDVYALLEASLPAPPAGLEQSQRMILLRIAGMFREMGEDRPGGNPWRDLSRSDFLGFAGDIDVRLGRLDSAEAAYRRSSRVLEGLSEADHRLWNYYKYKIWALDRLGELLLGRNRPGEAEPVLRQALGLRANLPEPEPKGVSTLRRLIRNHDLLGQIAQAGGRPAEAEESYRRALKEGDALARRLPSPSSESVFPADTLARLGLLLMTTGRPAEAEAAGRDALARLAARPDHETDRAYWNSVRAFAHGVRAAARFEVGRPEEAAADLREAQAFLGLEDPKALAIRAEGTESDGGLGPSKRIVRRLAAMLPMLPSDALQRARNLNDLAWNLVIWSAEFRDPALAVRFSRQAVTLDPDSSGYWNTLGLALQQDGDQAGAIAAIRRSMELGAGGRAEDWLILAMAHHRLGDRPEALRWLGKARDWIDLNPDKPPVDRMILESATNLLGLPRRPQ